MPSGNGGAPGGSTVPHSPIRAPPTGLSGRGSGFGAGASDGGISERSSGGGGAAWYRQPDVPGLVKDPSAPGFVTDSAAGGGATGGCASTGPASATAVNVAPRTAAARAAATRDGDRRIKKPG